MRNTHFRSWQRDTQLSVLYPCSTRARPQLDGFGSIPGEAYRECPSVPAHLDAYTRLAYGHAQNLATRGTTSNRDGIGAKVTVFAGGHRFVQEVRSGSSYISNNDVRLHFGLGNITEADRIEVRWPNGNIETFPGGSTDRLVTLTEGQGAIPTGS
jgi:hypothetical protein